MTDLNKIDLENLIELTSQQAKETNGGYGGVVPCHEEECPVHDPDNPLDEYIILH
jgi:hypothetical protein